MPKYIVSYLPIINNKQRTQYKKIFDADFKEYNKLYAESGRVYKKFTMLEKKLNECKQGSNECKQVKKQVWREYKQYINDTKYHESIERFQFLQEKLSHIKQLVDSYDARFDDSDDDI